jgi:hypothetical protein
MIVMLCVLASLFVVALGGGFFVSGGQVRRPAALRADAADGKQLTQVPLPAGRTFWIR